MKEAQAQIAEQAQAVAVVMKDMAGQLLAARQALAPGAHPVEAAAVAQAVEHPAELAEAEAAQALVVEAARAVAVAVARAAARAQVALAQEAVVEEVRKAALPELVGVRQAGGRQVAAQEEAAVVRA